MRHFLIMILAGVLGLLPLAPAFAIPTQYGHTGLLSVPEAQTLNEGNICVGLWTNCTTGAEEDGAIVPVAITLGLGTFMEAYGSYPNLLFNGDEDVSGRGFANLGFKFRVFGKRADPFRLGLDLQARRSVSDIPERDGLTAYASTLIASYRWERFGLHANYGYIVNSDSPDDVDYDDQSTFGGGIEYYPTNRLRVIAEYTQETDRESAVDGQNETTLGFQFFLTPHLTMNLGAGIDPTDSDAGVRILFGLATCQGVGTYNRPVPKLIDADKPDDKEPKVKPRTIKVRPLTPLVMQGQPVDSPITKLEVPLINPREGASVNPADRMPRPDFSKVEAAAVSPVTLPAAKIATVPTIFPSQLIVHRQFRFPETTFAIDQFGLTPEGQQFLALVAEELRREGRDFLISIEGHTDNVGSESYNQDLSYQRALAIANHLVLRNGFDQEKIFVKGLGESMPIADNATEQGRAMNLRVELRAMVKAPRQGADQQSDN
jgi:outer membrane protein OmpA-like peptidoglycan-associated protein